MSIRPSFKTPNVTVNGWVLDSEGRDRRVGAPDLAQCVAHLADRRSRGERRAHRVEHVVLARRWRLRDATHLVEGTAYVVGGALRTKRRQALCLVLLDR